jgi:hypothetical protein
MNLYKVGIKGTNAYVTYIDTCSVVAENFNDAIEKAR